MNKKIGFIGCGNMGKAMLGALVKSNDINKNDIIVSTKSKTSAEKISDEFAVKTTTVNIEVAEVAGSVDGAEEVGVHAFSFPGVAVASRVMWLPPSAAV